MYTPKIANIFYHIQEPSWLLITVDQASKTNSWKTNQAAFFCVRQVYFTNSCQQIRGCVNQPFILLYITSEVKQYFLSYRPRTEYGISQFFKVQDDQSWAFSETVQKIDLATVFDAILTSRQTREKLQCLYENLMSDNFRKTAVLKKISIVN